MKTVQMTLDESLVEAVDRAARKLGKSRSAFTRDALREALARERARSLERRHRRGYAHHPVEVGEFDVWESEQVWTER
ncbi:MAG: CopG family transcriptional regulator [Acidobacteria bacterium]|nr:MAG: CopG family transcriptional regulator [Acidobacteriota bacterium]